MIQNSILRPENKALSQGDFIALVVTVEEFHHSVFTDCKDFNVEHSPGSVPPFKSQL